MVLVRFFSCIGIVIGCNRMESSSVTASNVPGIKDTMMCFISYEKMIMVNSCMRNADRKRLLKFLCRKRGKEI